MKSNEYSNIKISDESIKEIIENIVEGDKQRIEKYPEHIMRKLRQRLDLKPEDTRDDMFIMKWNKDKVFNEVCSWEGFINWGNTIQGWIEDIYGIKFEDLE